MDRILIVDDEFLIRYTLEEGLKDRGYDAYSAATVEEGLEFVRKYHPGVLLLDNLLENSVGMDEIVNFKNADEELQVIMMTAYGSVSQAVEATKRGAYDYILKPFDVDEIDMLIKRCLEQKRNRDSLVFLKGDVPQFLGVSEAAARIRHLIQVLGENLSVNVLLYKETFTKEVEIDSKYAKQSGGRGQYGHCRVRFTPMDPNGENTYEFESTVVGGAIPKEYIPAVDEGIQEAAQAGILAGFPVLGIHANCYDGSYHEVDSSEMAFHIAGSMAFKDAMKKGDAVLLEPIMKVEVTMPEEYMGDVIGSLNAKRGQIEGMDDIGGGKIVRAFVPLAEMFGYSTELRSTTQGRGNYSMFFEKYEKCPKNVQDKVLAQKNG